LKRELFNTQIEKFAKKVEGYKELLDFLKKRSYLLALASQNEPRMIESALRWLNAKKYFKVILSFADIKNKKPDPEIYLLAAKRLGVNSCECMVIEDSSDGIMAAKNGGFKCIALKHDYMPQEIYKDADTVVEKLVDIIKYLKR